MGFYHEKMPARYAFQTSVRPEARQYAKLAGESTLPGRLRVFAHWQRFNKHYLNAGSRNAWFGTPNLTGSIGDSLVDTVNQEVFKAQAQGRGAHAPSSGEGVNPSR